MSQPSSFLRAVSDRLPCGRVLDVACGAGRNARVFVERGDRVVGIDRSHASLVEARRALDEAANLALVQADLESYPLPEGVFDTVANFRYLQRSLVPRLRRALRPGGAIVFETFLVDQLALGHPRNPEFVLQHNELLALFAGFRILHYEEGSFPDGDGRAHLARLLALRPA